MSLDALPVELQAVVIENLDHSWLKAQGLIVTMSDGSKHEMIVISMRLRFTGSMLECADCSTGSCPILLPMQQNSPQAFLQALKTACMPSISQTNHAFRDHFRDDTQAYTSINNHRIQIENLARIALLIRRSLTRSTYAAPPINIRAHQLFQHQRQFWHTGAEYAGRQRSHSHFISRMLYNLHTENMVGSAAFDSILKHWVRGDNLGPYHQYTRAEDQQPAVQAWLEGATFEIVPLIDLAPIPKMVIIISTKG